MARSAILGSIIHVPTLWIQTPLFLKGQGEITNKLVVHSLNPLLGRSFLTEKVNEEK